MSVAFIIGLLTPASSPVVGTRAADFSIFPILFAIYVIYSIFAAMGKAAKQARDAANAPTDGSQAAPQGMSPQQAVTTQPSAQQQQYPADQMRAVIALRRAAQAAAQQQAQRAMRVPVQTIRPVAPAAPPPVSSLPSFGTPSLPDLLAVAATAQPPALMPEPGESGVSLTTLLTSLPLAAQAVVASAVIGPCAAHRGGGHIPEDW